jgi:hypothetical protein
VPTVYENRRRPFATQRLLADRCRSLSAKQACSSALSSGACVIATKGPFAAVVGSISRWPTASSCSTSNLILANAATFRKNDRTCSVSCARFGRIGISICCRCRPTRWCRCQICPPCSGDVFCLKPPGATTRPPVGMVSLLQCVPEKGRVTYPMVDAQPRRCGRSSCPLRSLLGASENDTFVQARRLGRFVPIGL